MKRHVLLTIGRSGSNTLCDMLNQSPQVLNFGEVLGEWNQIREYQRALRLFRNSDEAYLDFILNSHAFHFVANTHRNWRKRRTNAVEAVKRLGNVQTVGVKDFSLNFQRYGLTDFLEKRPEIQVIGLVREDVVGRMISNAQLGATGVVALRTGQDRVGGTLWIDPAHISEMLTTIERENAFLAQMLASLPSHRVLVIRYEDLYRDPDAKDEIMKTVFSFLNVEPIQPDVRMRKIITTPVSEVVENFEDCLVAVKGTRFEALLREAAGY